MAQFDEYVAFEKIHERMRAMGYHILREPGDVFTHWIDRIVVSEYDATAAAFKGEGMAATLSDIVLNQMV